MSLATHCIPWDADCSLCNPPAAVAPTSAPKCNCHLHENTVCDICQGVGGKDVAPPETTAPTATPMDERVVRHPNGHLMIERTPMYVPSQEEEDKALGSLSKAWPVLAKHASHIDGEFDLAHSEVRRMFKAFRARIAAVSPVASSATPTPEPPRSFEEVERMIARVNASGQTLAAALASSQQEVERYRAALKQIQTIYDESRPAYDRAYSMYEASVRALTTEPR